MRRLNQIFGSGTNEAHLAVGESQVDPLDHTPGVYDADVGDYDTTYGTDTDLSNDDSYTSEQQFQSANIQSKAPPWRNQSGAEKRAKSQNFRRWRQRIGTSFAASTAVFLVIGGFWALTTGRLDVAKFKIQNSAEASLGSFGLTLNEFILEGERQYTTKIQIGESLNASQGEPILAVDPAVLRQRLLTLPWVKEAMVERVLPNRIIVTLKEHKPLAVWQFQGKQKLLDQQGGLIDVQDLAAFNKFPVVVGKGADEHAPEFLEMVGRVSRLASKLKVAQLVNGRRWTLKLHNGVLVHLPEENALAALNQIATLDKTDSLLSRDVLEIDLRLADRMVVRTNSGVSTVDGVPSISSPNLGERT